MCVCGVVSFGCVMFVCFDVFLNIECFLLVCVVIVCDVCVWNVFGDVVGCCDVDVGVMRCVFVSMVCVFE